MANVISSINLSFNFDPGDGQPRAVAITYDTVVRIASVQTEAAFDVAGLMDEVQNVARNMSSIKTTIEGFLNPT